MKILLVLLLCLLASFAGATSEWGTGNFTEYIPGTLSIILTVPHGGTQTTPDIPDRNCTGVPDCTTVLDSHTIALTRSISDSLFNLTGERPHVVIMYLSRGKIDANRPIEDASEENALAETIYNEFHGFIEKACNYTSEHFERGLLVDIHGQGHAEMWVELGYLLSGSELGDSDEELQEYEDECSLRGLSSNFTDKLADIIRGPKSLGGLLEARGYPSVPSPENPSPDGGNYFSGGYITDTHGSRTGGSIDAVQIESPRDVRFEEGGRDREVYAYDVAVSLLEFMETFYPSPPASPTPPASSSASQISCSISLLVSLLLLLLGTFF